MLVCKFEKLVPLAIVFVNNSTMNGERLSMCHTPFFD